MMLNSFRCWLSGHVRDLSRGPFFHCHRCGKYFDPRAALTPSADDDKEGSHAAE
jgi:hypothetical protein